MVFKGLKFGLLLQFAIGPVCIFIFQTASSKGFYIAETAVAGVVIIDGLYILAAILGISSLIERKKIKIALKIFSTVILFIFGLSIVFSQFNVSFLPNLGLENHLNSSVVFFQAILLTVSNPLTIIFLAGVFSTKVIEENMKRKAIYFFGLGIFLSSVLFLTLIALGGSLTKHFLSNSIIQMLNLIVGLLLIYFAFQMIFKKV
ncbi:LysE family translocator [Syntrophobotulus glycolicus]|nr:LysE family transporter [Syntrophobotulus glycolicus]